MSRREKRVFTFLWILVLSFCIFPTKATPTSFPIGLQLVYHIIDDSRGIWNERFEILRWAPEVSDTTLIINFSFTNEVSAQSCLCNVDISTWTWVYPNISATTRFFQGPLWVNLSGWYPGETVSFPPSSNEFYLSSVYASVSLGTFSCWQARSVAWFSIDDDYQLSSENWYFHHSQGLLVRYTSELLASQHGIYTHRYTRELVTSNLDQFGILSIEVQSQLLLQGFGLILPGVFVIVLVGALVFKKYRHD